MGKRRRKQASGPRATNWIDTDQLASDLVKSGRASFAILGRTRSDSHTEEVTTND